VNDSIKIELLNEAEASIANSNDLYSNVQCWLTSQTGRLPVTVIDKQVTLQMINAAILPWSKDQYQLTCEYTEARDAIQQLLPQSLHTIKTQFDELFEYQRHTPVTPPQPLHDDSDNDDDHHDDHDIVIHEPVQKQQRKRKPSGGTGGSSKKRKPSHEPLQDDILVVVSRPQYQIGTITAIQDAYLRKPEHIALHMMPIVSQITIADDTLERLLACALGKQTLRTFKVAGTTDSIPNESPPCGIALVSAQTVHETQAPTALSEEAFEGIGAQYAYTLVTIVQGGQIAVLYNVFGNMLVVGTKNEAIELHNRLRTSSITHDQFCTQVAIPRIISRDGHDVSSNGLISKLDIDGMTDATTGQRIPPYFASGTVANATADTTAAVVATKGKGKGKAKAKKT
jgi:hypothetical protein